VENFGSCGENSYFHFYGAQILFICVDSFFKYRFFSKLVDFLQDENEIFCEDLLAAKIWKKIYFGGQKMVKIMHP